MPPSTPATFSDPLTGRRIHRLTHGGLNASPYFNSYAWTPQGDAVCYLRWEEGGKWVRACEVGTGRNWALAGPFAGSEREGPTTWPTLNALPGERAVTFVADRAVWRADLEGSAERVADLPPGDCDLGDTDVSADDQWHEQDPIWSPDGTRVLFRVVQSGECDLYVVEVD